MNPYEVQPLDKSVGASDGPAGVDSGVPPYAGDATPPPRRIGALADVVIVLAYISMAGSVVVGVASLLATLFLEGWHTNDPADDTFGIEYGLGILGLVAIVWLVTIAGLAALVAWCVVASENSRRLLARSAGSATTDYGNGWSILGWLIPLANLVVPYRVMKQNLNVPRSLSGDAPSTAVRDWRTIDAPPLLSHWWTFWLLSRITISLENRLSTTLEVDDPMVHGVVNLMSTIFTAFAYIYVIRVVRLITDGQNAATDGLPVTDAPVAPSPDIGPPAVDG